MRVSAPLFLLLATTIACATATPDRTFLKVRSGHGVRKAAHRAVAGAFDWFTGPRVQEDASTKPSSQLTYTTENGREWFQPQGAQRVGQRGPLLLQDTHLLDTLAHFVRERIPERVVHARGLGAHGTFTITTDFASKYSMADVFKKGTVSPVTIRFSTVGGGRGSADAARDPRGFAIKIRTKKGILDWVFNNTPVFFIRDPTRFRTFIHTQKTDPATNTNSKDAVWDYFSQAPESMLQAMRLMSDLGTPASVRNMNGWSGHTYRLVDENGKWVYTRVLLETDQGIKNFTAAEAAIASQSPEHATMDLYNAIAQGQFPSWTVKFQVMTKEEAAKYRYDVLDLTKDWLDVPYHEVGKIVLNQNPVNYFAEIEQSHFSPSNMVDGWAPSADPVLQARLFSYNDAGRHRLGPNYLQIPVNCPLNVVANFQRDGLGAVLGNAGNRPNYLSSQDPLHAIPRPKWVFDDDDLESTTTYWSSQINETIDYEQPKIFVEKTMSQQDRTNLISNIVGSLGQVQDKKIVENTLQVFAKISAELEAGVRKGLGGDAKSN
ncbi:unnamed protein product [Tilletia controversa]|uniref:Catalase core domain-containing protein n=2 Tax=Tilletia TaxID=13289 RepID=A0A9N8QC00_9BASI|nr:hypothetical protein CF336_g2739 [Tilletia laevis]CAD6884558.1 unnamed protein product [Tilletia caries]CAD6899368.1 unnamed protein product [Tilletia controversa]CAD6903688.1 unnamed protein product [Tilletia caries]CAD6909835.1 unnamed protein product [Tilletia caries]